MGPPLPPQHAQARRGPLLSTPARASAPGTPPLKLALFCDRLDSRFWSRFRRPIGPFKTELLGVLPDQPLPAVELHRLGASDGADRSSLEKVIKNIEANVPSSRAPRDEATIDVVPQRQARAA